MNEHSETGWVEGDLLFRIASQLLEAAGYVAKRAPIDSFSVPPLTAEDPYSILAIVSAASWGDVADSVGSMQLSFANWAVDRHPDKKWDLYLVFLLTGEIDEASLASVEATVSDISFTRKIVRGAVLPTTESVESALAPFLPVGRVQARPMEDPLEDLAAELRAGGIDTEIVAKAIASFRSSGQVELP